MDLRHRQLLREFGADDADVRGEHVYPHEVVPQNGSAEDARKLLERKRYMAGADGTQEIPAPPVEEPPEKP